MAYQKVIVDGLEQDDVTKNVVIDCTKILEDVEHFVITDVHKYKVGRIKLRTVIFNIEAKSLTVIGIDSGGNSVSIASDIELFSVEDLKTKMQETLDGDIDGQVESFNQGGLAGENLGGRDLGVDVNDL